MGFIIIILHVFYKQLNSCFCSNLVNLPTQKTLERITRTSELLLSYNHELFCKVRTRGCGILIDIYILKTKSDASYKNN